MADATPAKPKRPAYTKFRHRYIDLARLLMSHGATEQELAAELDVTVATLRRWKATNLLFADACKFGEDAALERVKQAMYHRAIGYSHPATKILVVDKAVEEVEYTQHYPPDTQAGQYILNNRDPARWRTRTTTELEAGKSLADIVGASWAIPEKPSE